MEKILTGSNRLLKNLNSNVILIFTLPVIDRDVSGVGYWLILNNVIYRGANIFAGETNSFALSIKKILKEYCNYHNNLILNGQSIPIEEIEINHYSTKNISGADIKEHFFR